MIAEYVRRELLLKEVRRKARSGGGAKQWKKVEEFLEAVFSRGQLVDVEEVKKDDVVEPVLTHDMMSF